MLSHKALIDRFTDGAISGTASHMFIDGDTLYSYGSHFPLLVKRDFGYLLNADRYSVTTSQHQGNCRHIATVAIPFSALEGARINPYRFTLLDKDTERVDTRQYKDKDGNTHQVEERRPDSCVITQDKRYFLSSMDNWRYFIVELPSPCQTCPQAFDMLIPPQVKGKEYQRQGEWFVIPSEVPQTFFFTTAREMYRYMAHDYTLPHKDSGNPHTATRGCTIEGIHYVSGQIHHPEHRMLRLSQSDNPQIFQAWENTALGAWSAKGRVD